MIKFFSVPLGTAYIRDCPRVEKCFPVITETLKIDFQEFSLK
jgi:hypothetical protein